MIIKFEEMLRYDIFIFSLYNIVVWIGIFDIVFFNEIRYKEYVLLIWC